ncbi:peptidase inhibitor family I36 protein [Streptomyces sp. GMY02]|uniref:peptidase inhibitor family I36 protein n=1 Tax=Streptomyces sp. GMY02 TaxID=1333528 RepID=UPI001C2B953E|nr:peptidase inhibitor family I36 protein [Streptomyces sp. GMY02]QXE35931.1 peptidase inhibitor family I36 protein [Streptomyces sp. GMY02]
MGIARVAVTLTAAACAVVVGMTTAVASPASAPEPEVGILTPEAEAEVNARLEQSKPVIALYKGRQINLADGWQGAQACTEVPSGKVYCYDSTEEADAALPTIDPSAAARKLPGAAFGPTAFSDCSSPYFCLFESGNGAGRRLQWSADGTKQLADWDFRDKASSACVVRPLGGALVYDARTGLPDPYMALGNLACYNFIDVGYPTGGSWNDKADYVEL